LILSVSNYYLRFFTCCCSLLNQKRILSIFWSALKQAIVPALGLCFSWLITKHFSKELWGGLTQVTIWLSIITHIASWGNTDYLLRQFSTQPASLKQSWQKNFTDRLPILLIACLVPVIWLRNTLGLLIAAWCIIEYTYQSFQPLINFQKKFKVTVFAEAASFLVLFLLIYWFRQELNLTLLVILCMVSDAVKTAIAKIYFIRTVYPFKFQLPDFTYYTATFWFFLLGFMGLLSSRADLIYVTTFLHKTEIAFYQIITTFFSYICSAADMLILPFVPALYRLRKSIVYKLSLQFTLLGIVLSAMALTVVYFIVTKVYMFQPSILFMFWGFIYVMADFFSYSIVIYLFRLNKQHKVALFGLIAVALNFSLCYLLVPRYGSIGAIAAASIAHWAIVPLYLYQVSKAN